MYTVYTVYIYIPINNNTMKTIIVNIATETVRTNGQVCNFIEAGLTNNSDPIQTLSDASEIEEVLTEQYEGQEINVIFE